MQQLQQQHASNSWCTTHQRYSSSPAHHLSCRLAACRSAALGKAPATYINRSVREEEHVQAPGSVVVLGNVPPSATIAAAGDVCVFGRLAGHVHAGCSGDRSAVISALELRGAQLIIAQCSSLGAARITVPGPHTASVSAVGRSITMNLTPLGPSHPALNPVGLTSSVSRWLSWYPAAAAALFTGCYALLAGCALVVAPKTVFGLLFDAASVPAAFIQVGGVLFATFGAQYLGTAVADYRQVLTASNSSSGCPDMPFRPASPHPAAAVSQSGGRPAAAAAGLQAAPAAVAATYQQPHNAAAAAAAAAAVGGPGLSDTAAALLHDSSSAFVDFSSSSSSSASASVSTRSSSSSSSMDGTAGSSSSSGDGVGGGARTAPPSSSTTSRPVGRSVPAGQLTAAQVEQLRQEHKQRHRAAADAGAGNAGQKHREWQSLGHQPPSLGGSAQSTSQQQQQQQATWAYCSSGFYEASVWTRLALAAAFTLLVAVCQAPAGLLVLALINVIGALSMWGALRRQWLIHVMGDFPEAAGMAVTAS